MTLLEKSEGDCEEREVNERGNCDTMAVSHAASLLGRLVRGASALVALARLVIAERSDFSGRHTSCGEGRSCLKSSQ